MKKISSISLIFFALLTFSACEKFLDVQPHDRITQDQTIVSEYRINMLLNGIYLEMAENHLYGANLTMSVVEALAQRYNITNIRSAPHWYTRYIWTDTERVMENVNAQIWEGLYAQALAINDFLDILDRTTAIASPQRKRWLRGEALALRAFYHFDILRMWGPSPGGDAAEWEIPFMPYNNVSTGRLQPLQAAGQILELIMQDLDSAAIYLFDDPVISRGANATTTFDHTHDFYQTHRNYRMNYFAVKAMQARVYLWKASNLSSPQRMEHYQQAFSAADEVINAGGRHFLWVRELDIITGLSPDRIFSTEVIFGIHNRFMYSNYDRFFAPTLDPQNELAPLASRLEEVFEVNTGLGRSDFRYVFLWRDAGGGKDYRVFWKYARPNDRTQAGATERVARTEFFQPLIRMSEMYYIAAESGFRLGIPPATIWNDYLNVVRAARRIATPYVDQDILTEILREYEKEFWGEGQLFYFFKRHNEPSIPSATSESGFIMPDYLIPIPQTEIIARGT